jgi:hypothetical protein
MPTSAAVVKRKQRAKRARAKQRPRGHDLRGQYRQSDVPAASHVGVMMIEDPYSEASRIDSAGNIDVSARLESVHHPTGQRPRALQPGHPKPGR